MSLQPAPGPAPIDPAWLLRDERLRLHRPTAVIAPVAAGPLAVLLVALLWPYANPGSLLAWLLGVALALAARLGSRHWHDRHAERPDQALRAYQLSFLLHGLAWAAATPLLLVLRQESAHDVLVLALLAIAASSMIGASFDPRAVLCFSVPPLLALAAALLALQRWPAGGMALVFLALAVLGTRRAQAGLQESVRLRLVEAERTQALHRLRLADLTLARQHRQLAQLQQRTTQGILFTDAMGLVTQANPALCAMLGCTEADLLGREPGLPLAPEARQTLQATLVTASQQGRAVVEIELPGSDGRRCIARISATTLAEAGAAFEGLVTVWTDITEQRQAERDLDTYRVVANSITDLVSVVDESHTYRLVNDAWCRATGLSREQAVGLSLLRVPKASAHDERMHAITECLRLRERRVVRSALDLPGLQHRQGRQDDHGLAARETQPRREPRALRQPPQPAAGRDGT